ncbi:hypothetical protein [Planotetraspora sp. GP83]|uniref:hypothetical protein n=1 Tax=Planotetraspora sp. GP83 TaxID=3156264 RepID=UPI0035176454
MNVAQERLDFPVDVFQALAHEIPLEGADVDAGPTERAEHHLATVERRRRSLLQPGELATRDQPITIAIGQLDQE